MRMHITAFFTIHNIKMIIYNRPHMAYSFQTFHEYIIHAVFQRGGYLDGAADIVEERFSVSFSPSLTFTKFGIGSTAPFLNLILIISFPCTSTAVT
ncbi:hypothetical protein VACV_TT8_239 [Vaccinia virus]|uniref:Uncharacterized protein n=1 Tax=Vaccinia virus TaxID=10245 RepID=M9WJ36_VACCV|nr:hypothetical protein VACV_TT8_239 [Vaccinia virus]